MFTRTYLHFPPHKFPSKPFKRQPHKMVKHIQTIRRQRPTNYLSVFEHFVGWRLRVNIFFPISSYFII